MHCEIQNQCSVICYNVYFCHDNSRRDWHGNVHDNVNVFGLGGIDLLRCCCCCDRASTETCYCQYIHKLLLWACKKYCCCKYNIHERTPYINHLVADLYRWSWGRWRVSEARCEIATTSTSHIFECWAESSLATDTGENQSAVPCDNDVIRSDWVRPIGLRHLEFHARTLYFTFQQTCIFVTCILYVMYIYAYWKLAYCTAETLPFKSLGSVRFFCLVWKNKYYFYSAWMH